MKNYKWILFISGIIGMCNIMKAQIPVGDSTWTLIKLDNFDSLNHSQWYDTYHWGHNNGGDEYSDAANVLFNHTAGYMSLKAERASPPIHDLITDSLFNYRSGTIESKFTTLYGYFEISAKRPKGKGYWLGYWNFGTDGGALGTGFGPCINVGYWNETDCLENNGSTSRYDQMGGGYVWADSGACTSLGQIVAATAPFQNLAVTGNVTQEHKYGFFWEKNRMTWFYDDVPIRTVFDSVFTPHNAMSTFINFGIEPAGWTNPPDSTTTFPAYYEVNHFKIWQLKSAVGSSCSTVQTFCASAFNPATYTYEVKKSISIGGSGCASPSTINTSSGVHLWATDFILLDEGTTINDNGSGSFTINLTDCPH